MDALSERASGGAVMQKNCVRCKSRYLLNRTVKRIAFLERDFVKDIFHAPTVAKRLYAALQLCNVTLNILIGKNLLLTKMRFSEGEDAEAVIAANECRHIFADAPNPFLANLGDSLKSRLTRRRFFGSPFRQLHHDKLPDYPNPHD